MKGLLGSGVRWLPLAVWACAASATTVRAQDPGTAAEGETPAAADAAAGPIPESPAFIFLGATPSEVSRPATVRSLGVGLAQGVDRDGRAVQGLAFEVTPAVYLTSVSLREYRENWTKYALSNLQLTFGTVRTAGDSASTDLAVGIRLPVFDAGDAMRNRAFTDSIGERMKACAPAGTPDEPAPSPETIESCLAEATAPVAVAWAAEHWNASALTFAAATGTRLVGSRLDERRWLGLQLWLHGALQVGSWGQFVVQASYLDSRRAQVQELDYKATALGARLLVGGRVINGFVETSEEFRFDHAEAVKPDAGRWSAGVEFRVGEELWIATGVGTTYESVEQPDRALVFANMRWGVAERARLSPAPGSSD